MKERPIIFSPAMAGKVVADLKSQTRRVVKPHHGWEKHSICNPDMAADPWAVWWHYPETDRVGHLAECPYGKPGSFLWVRESWIEGFPTGETGRWSCIRPTNFEGHGKAFYWADGEDPADGPQRKWRHAMFMPRWASRSTLEITGVRVERVQDISEADSKAEGVRAFQEDGCGVYEDYCLGVGTWCWTARDSFCTLWDSINGKREGCSWADNPWVFAISFRRLEASVTQLAMDFDGRTYDPALDRSRLNAQLRLVWDLMRDGKWRTLGEITAAVKGGSEAGVSARLRDIRKDRGQRIFGKSSVERRRTDTPGLWEYRIVQEDQA